MSERRHIYMVDEGIEECCEIAECMMDEIECIRRGDEIGKIPSEGGKLKGSFRRKLVRRIKSFGGDAV